MSSPGQSDQIDLLKQARERTVRLVEDMQRQQDELEGARSPIIHEESLAHGRQAMEQMVASTQRLLHAMDAALADVEPEQTPE